MKIINNLPKKIPIQEQIGKLSELTTTIKINLVAAINWLHALLLEKLGSTDISSIGDGTVTGAISKLNTEISNIASGANENLIPYPYYHTTVTKYGVSFVDNGDGTVTIKAGSKATADTMFIFLDYTAIENTDIKRDAVYTASGGISSNVYFNVGMKNSSGTYYHADDTGNGATFSLSNYSDIVTITLRILVKSGTKFDEDVTFKPMLEVGSTAHEYKQYSMSNAGLQKQIDEDVVHNSKISNSSAITETGKYVLDATEKNASVEGTLANQIGTINTNLQTFETRKNIVPLDTNTHTMISAETELVISVPNLSKYRYIKITGYCGDSLGTFCIVFTNHKDLQNRHIINISASDWWAFAIITVNFTKNEVSINGRSKNWGIDLNAITRIDGICPIE